MAISDWPTAERPRERLLAQGAAHLSDAELLALCLRTGIAGASAVAFARGLIAQFSGLRSPRSSPRSWKSRGAAWQKS